MSSASLHRSSTEAEAPGRRSGEERTDTAIRARLLFGIDLLISGRVIPVLLISLILIAG